MNRRDTEPVWSASVAVVGAESPCGAFLREALAEQGVPGARVELFGSTHGEAVLTEYDGEARLIQDPDPVEIRQHDVVFLCDTSEAAKRVASDPDRQGLVLDLVAARPRDRSAPLVHPDINAHAIASHEGIVAVPHPLSVVLARVFERLEAVCGVRRATVVAVRPAADFGERGLEELRDQTVGLLRFSDPPKAVFGRQLAFNLIPEGLLPPDNEPALEARLASEVGVLLGWAEPRLTVALLAAPVFYGHAIVLRVVPARPATLAQIVEACRTLAAVESDGEADATTPIDAAGSRSVVASQVREDGFGGFWLWIVAGEAGAAAAELAVRVARMAASA